MQEWALRAMKRWPNVPGLFGWLSLDRRGRWLIRGESISRPQIVDTINANYAADAHGRWFFQNGPQRGYMQLAYAPFVLRASADGGTLMTHTGQEVHRVSQGVIDEEGSLLLMTEHGPGLVSDDDLDWALQHLTREHTAIDADMLAHALDLPSGSQTSIVFTLGGMVAPVVRVDAAAVPDMFHFARDPKPLPGEHGSSNP